MKHLTPLVLAVVVIAVIVIVAIVATDDSGSAPKVVSKHKVVPVHRNHPMETYDSYDLEL
jgi:hypothetical protein